MKTPDNNLGVKIPGFGLADLAKKAIYPQRGISVIGRTQ
jgi:hypothetical protein